MKNVFILASLSLAALSLGQSLTYVPGHIAKGGKWIAGHWQHHTSQRPVTLSDYDVKPFSPMPKLDVRAPSIGDRYVPGRYDLSIGGYVSGHFAHHSTPNRFGGFAPIPQFHFDAYDDLASKYRSSSRPLYGAAPRLESTYRPFYLSQDKLFAPSTKRSRKKSGFYGL